MDKDINFKFGMGTPLGKFCESVEFEAATVDIQVTKVKNSSVFSQTCMYLSPHTNLMKLEKIYNEQIQFLARGPRAAWVQ